MKLPGTVITDQIDISKVLSLQQPIKQEVRMAEGLPRLATALKRVLDYLPQVVGREATAGYFQVGPGWKAILGHLIIFHPGAACFRHGC